MIIFTMNSIHDYAFNTYSTDREDHVLFYHNFGNITPIANRNGHMRLTSLPVVRGDIIYLEFLCMQGCNWDKETCVEAARNGHLDCLRYALDNNCPCSNKERQRYLAMLV